MHTPTSLSEKQEAADKLIRARCRLLIKEPWYGHASMQMDWVADDMLDTPAPMRTMGVRILETGRVETVFCPEFVKAHSIEQLYGCIQHEIEHIVRCHCLRRGAAREALLWNIACDAAVNGKETRPKVGYAEDGVVKVLPIESPVWCPEKWNECWTAEQYYEKLLHDSPGDFPGNFIDNHEIWCSGTASADFARQVIKHIADTASQRAPGNIPGGLADAIAKLSDPIVNWRELLRVFLGNHIGAKRPTWSRRNRRCDQFGVKGFSHRGCGDIQVIVDTSGSVGKETLEKFFAEVNTLSTRAKIWVLQWDAGFQSYGRYRRGDWKNWKVQGRGGTDMAAPVKWLEDQGRISDVQVMLTDGEVSAWPEPRPYPMIFVVANTHELRRKPTWGNYVFIREGDD